MKLKGKQSCTISVDSYLLSRSCFLPTAHHMSTAVEGPYYGRTGILENRLTAPLPPPSNRWAARYDSVVLKWHPETVLVVPQRLLHHFIQEAGSIPLSFGILLLMQALAESLTRAWTPVADETVPESLRRVQFREHQTIILDYLLHWHAHCVTTSSSCDRGWQEKEKSAISSSSSGPVTSLSWFIPSYTLVGMKDEKTVERYPEISWRSVTLIGKDTVVNDIGTQHPSCSGQHAALQVAFSRVGWENEVDLLLQEHREADESADEIHGELGEVVSRGQLEPYLAYLRHEAGHSSPSGDNAATPTLSTLLDSLYEGLLDLVIELGGVQSAWTMELQLIDLCSTNGTYVNQDRLTPYVPHVLLEGDIIRFGMSSRTFVLMRPAK